MSHLSIEPNALDRQEAASGILLQLWEEVEQILAAPRAASLTPAHVPASGGSIPHRRELKHLNH
jgi:hypothetical protein